MAYARSARRSTRRAAPRRSGYRAPARSSRTAKRVRGGGSRGSGGTMKLVIQVQNPNEVQTPAFQYAGAARSTPAKSKF